ncbi:MAG: hypothetical protein ICV83_09610, partial [Cytophagales bacterium]|nr:hypothetical protein [Cytophagales bacterium]
RKGALLLVLLVALMCFGARGSLYTSVLAVGVLYVYPVFFTRNAYFARTNKLAVVLLLGVATAALAALVLFTPFGERLVATSFYDEDSAGVRVKVLDLIDLSQPSRYLWAKSAEEIEFLMYLFDVDIIENFVFIWILKFGLLFTALLYAAVFAFLLANNGVQSKWFATLTVALFFLTANTNNSLATSTSAISIFVILFTVPTGTHKFVL